MTDSEPAAPRSPWRLSAVFLPLVWGVVAASWTPRGPLSIADAMWSLTISAVVGLAVGWLLRTRWSALIAPVGFALALELARMHLAGPTVDRPRLSATGVEAFVAGRGVHAVLSLVPLAVGARAAATVRRFRLGSPLRRTLRLGGTAALLAGVIVTAVVLGRPAWTDPVTDDTGAALPNTVAELTEVPLPRHRLSVMLRGTTTAPVLLYLGDGGESDIGAMRNHLRELESRFVVATWDQRGAIRSYAALDPTADYTVDAAVDDVIAMTHYLRARFGQDKIYLVGHGYGSLAGVLAAQRHPELYRAYVGAGQLVNPRTSDRIRYDDTVAWASGTGDHALVTRLIRQGPPPYRDFYDYDDLDTYEWLVYPVDAWLNSEGRGNRYNIRVGEYTRLDKLHYLGAVMDTKSVLRPRVQDLDLAARVPRLEVPAFFVTGERQGRDWGEPFAAWYADLRAPIKGTEALPDAGRRPQFEQSGSFVAYLEYVVKMTP